MALSSILPILLSIALLISVANANVDDTCKAAAASNHSINYNFCATSLRTNPKSETANARDLAAIATQLCLDKATKTKAKIEAMIRMGNQMPEITNILKMCSRGVYTNQIALLNGAVDSLKNGKFKEATLKIDTVKDRSHDCGAIFLKERQTDLLAKDENDLEGLSKLALFLVERL